MKLAASRLAPAEGRERACGASARNRPSASGGPIGLRPVGRYTGASRPKRNRPAAGRQVNGRFAPERKPACGRWEVHGRFAPESKQACGRLGLHGRFAPETKPAFGRWGYTGASRPEVNRPAAGGEVHGRFAPETKPAYGRWACIRKETGLRLVGMFTGA